MHRILVLIAAVVVSCSTSKKTQQPAIASEAERILKTLSSDDMAGRASFTQGAEKAASFIEQEFRDIGLQPLNGAGSFRHAFNVTRVNPVKSTVTVNGEVMSADAVAIQSDLPEIRWDSDVTIERVEKDEQLFKRYQQIVKKNSHVFVLVDSSHAKDFAELKNYLGKGRIINQPNNQLAAIFVMGPQRADSYTVEATNHIQTLPLQNIAAVLPGRSRAGETVIFSAHYDHIGVITPVNGDSIANGADDDASGVTAVLSLARYFSEQKDNERTIMFVAFTAEELGMVGSKHFSKKLNADSIVAMFNIEMIGKESKFGPRSAFITGFERSDFGEILQRNLAGTPFTFHPDPYTEQNLFYRSDNATLAAMGVPAHTISTSQIDNDKLYHSVDDEFHTLNVENVKATIEAIALSARGIVAGKDTPKRVAKPNE